VIPEDAFIEPIARAPAAPPPSVSPGPISPAPQNTDQDYYIDESLFIDPIEKTAGSMAGPAFSVPVIQNLEKGKYYVQLASFTRADLVELELIKLGTTYPLAVQTGGSAGQPLYRLLVGPVNQGEGGALLQRFRSSGYKDAFIKSN
jgi:cell division septation protein DedD